VREDAVIAPNFTDWRDMVDRMRAGIDAMDDAPLSLDFDPRTASGGGRGIGRPPAEVCDSDDFSERGRKPRHDAFDTGQQEFKPVVDICGKWRVAKAGVANDFHRRLGVTRIHDVQYGCGRCNAFDGGKARSEFVDNVEHFLHVVVRYIAHWFSPLFGDRSPNTGCEGEKPRAGAGNHRTLSDGGAQ
jgi:hypothetical protein